MATPSAVPKAARKCVSHELETPVLGSTGFQMVSKDGRETTTIGEKAAVLVGTVSELVRRKSSQVEARQLVSTPGVLIQEEKEILLPRPLLRFGRRGASSRRGRV